MGGLSLGPDGQQQQGHVQNRSYIPPHMRNRQGPPPPMNGPAAPAAAPAPAPAGPAPGAPQPVDGLGNSNWAK